MRRDYHCGTIRAYKDYAYEDCANAGIECCKSEEPHWNGNLALYHRPCSRWLRTRRAGHALFSLNRRTTAISDFGNRPNPILNRCQRTAADESNLNQSRGTHWFVFPRESFDVLG